jgi:hypothetical protein
VYIRNGGVLFSAAPDPSNAALAFLSSIDGMFWPFAVPDYELDLQEGSSLALQDRNAGAPVRPPWFVDLWKISPKLVVPGQTWRFRQPIAILA